MLDVLTGQFCALLYSSNWISGVNYSKRGGGLGV